MNIPAGLFPDIYLWLTLLGVALVLLCALRSARWSRLRDNEAVHVYLGAMVSVLVVWSLRGGIQPGLGYHLLGVTALYLMFDWQFALLAVAVVQAGATAAGMAGWEAYGVNLLVAGVVPIAFTRLLLYLCQLLLPLNFFIYVFINAFLAGALSMLLAGLASAGLQRMAGVQSASDLANNFLSILPMLMFGEGFLNGAIMSLAVAYRPGWVSTFHDSWYLQGK